MDNPRVRFAPSPTGELHVGGARTALFNWLFARRYGGRFVLRLDDTDRERFLQEHFQSILDSLRWLGLHWDEGPEVGGPYGPYIQSERLSLYQGEADKLLKEGRAYYCFCSVEELAERKEILRSRGEPPRYDGRCRNIPPEEAEKRMEQESFVIRIKSPEKGDTVVEDIVRGNVKFENRYLDDFILIRSNKLPTYNFASVVDDSKMEITHVIRAEEHLSNTPRQQIIAQNLGYNIPRYAHVPMILAPDHSKLSKRHGATAVHEYRDLGILPEALMNYLVLLGWSPGDDREIITSGEMIRSFSLERVSKNPAIYDQAKLTWLNAHYLRTADNERISELTLPFLQQEGLIGKEITPDIRHRVQLVVEAVRDRVRTLKEIAEAADYFFRDDYTFDGEGVEKHFRQEGVGEILNEVARAMEEAEPFEPETIKRTLKKVSKDKKVSPARVNLPTRLAISGRTMGPDLFETVSVLGRQKTVERIQRAVREFNLQ